MITTHISKPPQIQYEKAIRAEVDEFKDNKDGTSTLIVTCGDGHKVAFSIDLKRLKSLNVDSIYEILKKECRED